MEEGNPLTPSCNRQPASSLSPSSTSISGIIRKAIHFPLKNKKLMLRVFILVLLPFLMLLLLHTLVVTPLIAKVEDGYENSSMNHQDLISLLIIEIPFAFAFCLLLLFASAITILASVCTQQGKSLGLKEMLFSSKSTWKKIFVSGLYCSFIMIAFIGVTIILTQLTALMGVLAAILTYPYLVSICTLVLVISTVEDECHGKNAFKCATKITIQGRFQGYFLMLIMVLLSIPVYVLLYVTSTDDDDENGLIMQFGFLLVTTVLFCLTIFFNTVTYTLFYLDYKQRNCGQIQELETQNHSVPTSTVTADA